MHSRVLFFCGGNSCRSQMAEGLLRARAIAGVAVCSAGVTAQGVHPLAIKVMAELGIDISGQRSKTIADLPADPVDMVVTLCDAARGYCLDPAMPSGAAANSPVISGAPVLLHWAVDDPAEARGAEEQVLRAFRTARDELHRRLEAFIEDGYLEALAQSRSRLVTVLDSLDDGIMIHDDSRRIYAFNQAAEGITGYRRQDVIGRDCREVFPGGICGSHCQFKDGPPAAIQPVRELPFCTSDGEQRRLRVHTAPLRVGTGQMNQVLARFRDVTELVELRHKLEEKHSFRNMVGISPSMRAVFKSIEQVATSDYPALITGESGTGKELVARAIHQESRRAGGPFVPINCGALPDHILESELFGHVRGAFTGAVQSRKGRFELADGGTLLLDEVGELSATFQVKLLRVLQEKQFERVGGERPISVDVRIISATHRNLRELVRRGEFRQDLFYRLCVVPIELPPLRDRTEDLPLLWEQILADIEQETGSKVPPLAEPTKQLLLRYHWPGNVRELINALRFASVRSAGAEVLPFHLPLEILQSQLGEPALGTAAAGPAAEQHPAAEAGALPRRQGKLVMAAVRQALAQSGGNKVQAAKLLGVGRATLYRFLERHQL